MDQHRNSSVVAQCLGKLVSEAGEVLTVAGRAQGFGLLTPDTYREGTPVTARTRLNEEIGHFLASVDLGCLHGLLDPGEILAARNEMLHRLLDPTRRDYLDRPLAPAVPRGSYAILSLGVRHFDLEEPGTP